MDLSKLSTMQKVLGGAAVVLLVNLFLPWYGVGAQGFGNVNFNAFDVGFLAWGGSLLVIAGAVLVILKALAVNEVSAGTLQTEHLGLVLTGIGTALIVLRLITQTSFMKFGLFIGIVAAGAATFAAFQSMREAGLDMPTGDDFRSLGGDGGQSGGPSSGPGGSGGPSGPSGSGGTGGGTGGSGGPSSPPPPSQGA